MDEDRILDKLDDHTEKLTELGATMKMYMQNQNVLNDSLTKSMKEIGSEVVRMKLQDAASGHKCEEAAAASIKAHETESWAHNQYKAGGILAGLVAFVESIRGFFFHR